jgi:hypothetical protein
MDLSEISVILTIIFGIPSVIGLYIELKKHNKKNQTAVIQEKRILKAKNKVKMVLLSFCNDWNSYSKSKEYYQNADSQYIVFIGMEHRVKYHLDQFNLVSNEISELPKAVADKLADFSSWMRVIEDKSVIKSSDAWDRADRSSIVNQFDELLADIKEMYANLDEMCNTTKKHGENTYLYINNKNREIFIALGFILLFGIVFAMVAINKQPMTSDEPTATPIATETLSPSRGSVQPTPTSALTPTPTPTLTPTSAIPVLNINTCNRRSKILIVRNHFYLY